MSARSARSEAPSSSSTPEIKWENDKQIIIDGSMEPIETTQNTRIDPDLELKKELQALFPFSDGLMLDVAIANHRKLVEIYGDDYSEQQYIDFIENNSKIHNAAASASE